MMFDPIYFVFLAPALLLSLWASFRTKSAFNKYSQVRTATGLTGAEAAARMLAGAGITDVKIVAAEGHQRDGEGIARAAQAIDGLQQAA